MVNFLHDTLFRIYFCEALTYEIFELLAVKLLVGDHVVGEHSILMPKEIDNLHLIFAWKQ